MGERIVPIVPVLLNTYYPPNQPTARRCYRLGQAIRQSVQAWPAAKRVGVVGSGGLSHFVVDEPLDRHVLEILAKKDADAVAALPAAQLDSGNSEIRNWIAAAGAIEHLHMRPRGLRAVLPLRGGNRRRHGLRGVAIERDRKEDIHALERGQRAAVPRRAGARRWAS